MKRLRLADFWPAGLIAVLLIGGALLNEQSALRLLFGSSDYPDFQVSKFYRWAVFVSVPMLVLMMAIVQTSFVGIKSEYASHIATVKQDEKKLEEQRLLEAQQAAQQELEQKLAEGLAAQNARILRLESKGYSDIRVVREDETLRITEAERDVQLGDLSHREVRVEVDDIYGKEKLYLVFHIFEKTAFWRFDSAQLFEDASGDDLDFLGRLERSTLVSTLATYDGLVGVGLTSNSRLQPPSVADDRAKLLCGVLSSYSREEAKALGMSIGSYTKEPLDRRGSQQRQQRPVIILGVEKLTEAASEIKLIDEIIRSVEFSGTDLLHYEYLQTGRAPRWFEIQRCAGRI